MDRTALLAVFPLLLASTLSAQTVPLPPPVTIATDPPGATITIDGRAAAAGTPAVSIPPGLHTISVGDPSAPTWQRTWDLDSGDVVTVTLPSGGGGELQFQMQLPQPAFAPAPLPPGIDPGSQATITVNPLEERSGTPPQP